MNRITRASSQPPLVRSLCVAALVVAAPCVLAASGANSVTHLGGFTLDSSEAVRICEAGLPGSPVLAWESEALPGRVSAVTAVHDSLFVATGTQVDRYDRTRPSSPLGEPWSSDEDVVGLADGPERGLVLALHRRGLSLVRFSDTSHPETLWSEPLDLAGVDGRTGRLLVRHGNHVYVSDPTLPGARVFSIDDEAGPETIGTFSSPDGPIHDMAMWGQTLVLLTERGAIVTDIGPTYRPVIRTTGYYETIGRAASVGVTSRHLFLADGAVLLVLDVGSSSAGDSEAPVLATWVAPTEIRSVHLDYRGRAFVLLANSWEILDVSEFATR